MKLFLRRLIVDDVMVDLGGPSHMTFFRSFSNVALVRHIAVEYKAGRNHEFRPNAVRWELDYKVTTHAKHRKTFQLQHEIFVTTHAKHRKTFQLLHEIFFIKILLID